MSWRRCRTGGVWPLAAQRTYAPYVPGLSFNWSGSVMGVLPALTRAALAAPVSRDAAAVWPMPVACSRNAFAWAGVFTVVCGSVLPFDELRIFDLHWHATPRAFQSISQS